MSQVIAAPAGARTRYLRQLQAAILRHALYRGDVHADAVVAVLPVPDGVHHNVIGQAFSGLEAAGLIEAVGFERSARASRHRGVFRIWRACDVKGARAYLTALERSGGPDKHRLGRTLDELASRSGGDKAIRTLIGGTHAKR